MSKRTPTKAKVWNVGFNVGGVRIGLHQRVYFGAKVIDVYMIGGKRVTEEEFQKHLEIAAASSQAAFNSRVLDPAFE